LQHIGLARDQSEVSSFRDSKSRLHPANQLRRQPGGVRQNKPRMVSHTPFNPPLLRINGLTLFNHRASCLNSISSSLFREILRNSETLKFPLSKLELRDPYNS